MPRQPHEPPTICSFGSREACAPGLIDGDEQQHRPYVRDLPHHRTGILPFVVHQVHCAQVKCRDKNAWRRQHEENQSAHLR